MKYNLGIIGLLLLCAVLFQNCGKDDKDSTPSYISIEEYIAQKNISAEYTSSGLGYIITDSGDASRQADENSTVKTTILINTTDAVNQVDTEGDIFLNLSSQVSGLTEGLQLIGSGGTITLFVPYELAWGTTGTSTIPGSADVIMEVTLTEVLLDVESYIEENSITITETTTSGVYVLIEEEGDGTYPNENSFVNVRYTGYFTSGDVFDSNDSGLQISLNQVITGWKWGIPRFSKGAKGKLFIPYEEAYGDDGSAAIPGKTDLIFDIELLDIQ